jgi:hypothetical protein
MRTFSKLKIKADSWNGDIKLIPRFTKEMLMTINLMYKTDLFFLLRDLIAYLKTLGLGNCKKELRKNVFELHIFCIQITI